jgi:hypothetical protein
MKKGVIRGLLTLCLSAPAPSLPLFTAAQAQTLEASPAGPGNLPAGFYPAPPCPKPVQEEDKAERELAFSQGGMTQLAIDSYHRRIEKYNKAVIAYNQCAKTYIQNSRYDIERILSTVNAAVAEVQGTAPPQPPAAMGNLPADFYPRSPCARPDRTVLGAQPARTDIQAMAAYNLKVAAFNLQAEAFGACLKAYQDKARHDIQMIQVAVQPATVR